MIHLLPLPSASKASAPAVRRGGSAWHALRGLGRVFALERRRPRPVPTEDPRAPIRCLIDPRDIYLA